MSAENQRVVSLVPSLTQLVIDLGMKKQLVGRTRFCIKPKGEVEDIPIIGGTKNPHVDQILELNPDYVIANKEENRQEDVEALRQETEVNVTDIRTIEDALITNHEIGRDLGVPDRARELNSQIMDLFEERPNEDPLQTAYFIWRKPWMTVGHDTYIHDVMQHWNLTNITSNRPRYPTVDLKELADKNPELILLSSEPFPFKEDHIDEIESYFPDIRILLVNGQWFSWYGSHMVESFEKLNVWRKAIG